MCCYTHEHEHSQAEYYLNMCYGTNFNNMHRHTHTRTHYRRKSTKTHFSCCYHRHSQRFLISSLFGHSHDIVRFAIRKCFHFINKNKMKKKKIDKEKDWKIAKRETVCIQQQETHTLTRTQGLLEWRTYIHLNSKKRCTHNVYNNFWVNRFRRWSVCVYALHPKGKQKCNAIEWGDKAKS